MTLYCGIDLHANNSVITVLDEQDKRVYEKRLPNELPIIQEALQPYQDELKGCYDGIKQPNDSTVSPHEVSVIRQPWFCPHTLGTRRHRSFSGAA